MIISGFIIPAAYLVLPRTPSSRPATPSPADQESSANATHPPKKLLQSIRERLIRFDALGISVGVPGILLLTYALTSANASGWAAPSIISTLAVSVFLLSLFILHERAAPQAILAPHLFKSRSFSLTLVLAATTYAVRQACTYFLTLQLQSYGNSAIHTSVLFIPLGISALICNTLSGRLVPLLGSRFMVTPSPPLLPTHTKEKQQFIAGWLLAIPGIHLFTRITADASYWRTAFPGTILYIAGIGAV